MAITRKPKAAVVEPAPAVDVEALINKGGSVARDTPNASPEREEKLEHVSLRLPHALLERVNRAVKSRYPRMPRHSWIVESVMEKLEREEKNSK